MATWGKVYGCINWENFPSTETPLNESNLNKIDYAVNELDNRVIELNGYQVRAEESAQNAQASEENALFYAEQAEKYAESASDKALESKNSAELSESKASEAKGYCDTSSAKATEASTAADNAKISETNAQTSAQSAQSYSESAKNSEANAKSSENNSLLNAQNSQTSAASAKECEEEAEKYSETSKSYAVGGTGSRDNEDADNAKYYYEQTKQVSQGLNGIIPLGTVTFANLPTSGMEYGHMYNISDEFVSDERFNDGGGVYYGPGNNVIWISGDLWDVTAGSSVTGVKGKIESTYRQGNVELSAEDVGAVAKEDVDSALSATSTNPVQNKVISTELNNRTYNYGAPFIFGATQESTLLDMINLMAVESSVSFWINNTNAYVNVYNEVMVGCNKHGFADAYGIVTIEKINGSTAYVTWRSYESAYKAMKISYSAINNVGWSEWERITTSSDLDIIGECIIKSYVEVGFDENIVVGATLCLKKLSRTKCDLHISYRIFTNTVTDSSIFSFISGEKLRNALGVSSLLCRNPEKSQVVFIPSINISSSNGTVNIVTSETTENIMGLSGLKAHMTDEGIKLGRVYQESGNYGSWEVNKEYLFKTGSYGQINFYGADYSI